MGGVMSRKNLLAYNKNNISLIIVFIASLFS